ncbi:MAG: YciI family protein [Lysobacteraceae bacterium]
MSTKRFLVLTLRTPRFDPAVIAPHYAHLDRLRAAGVLELAGPFPDRTGGAYVLRVESLDEARALAFADPLHTSGASDVSVREWNAA